LSEDALQVSVTVCDSAFRLQTGSSAAGAAQKITTFHLHLGNQNTWRCGAEKCEMKRSSINSVQNTICRGRMKEQNSEMGMDGVSKFRY
jgi:hypothetical protein